MYVIDITRDNHRTDMLCGNNSMDAKNKTLDYVIIYALANYNISIDKDLLDQHLNIESFSLNNFLKENYSISIDDDLIIQSLITDKNNCLFVKYEDERTDIPLLYTFNKKELDVAHNILTFLVNDGLINKYKDDLSEYEKRKLDYKSKTFSITNFQANINCKIIYLYNKKGLFFEELLDNACSLNQLENINKNIFL